jgi:hypothetical protein
MRSNPIVRTLALAAVLAGSLALPAAAAPDRRAGPAGVGAWLHGLFAWDRFTWLAGEEGSGVDPNGATAPAAGDVGSMVDPNGATAAATDGEVGSGVDPNG